MKTRCLLLGLLLASNLSVAEPEKLLQALISELRAELKTGESSRDGVQNSRLARIESCLVQLGASEILEDERLTQTIQVLEQMNALSFSDKANELCRNLVAELRERSSNRAKEMRERFEMTVRSSLINGLKATTAEDLDPLLEKLARLQKDVQTFSYREGGRPQLNFEAMSTVEQILTMIQDCLLSAERKPGARSRDPIEALQSMTSGSGRPLNDIMPRSEFLSAVQSFTNRIAPGRFQRALSKQEFEQTVQALVESVKKIEELGPVLSKIENIVNQQREANGYYSDSGLVSQLRSYQQIYNQLLAGEATSLSFTTSTYASTGSDELSRVKDLLSRYALPRILAVAPEHGPRPNESIASYLQRVLAESRAASDWELLSRTLDVAQAMRLTSVANSSDTSALRLFLGGWNLERARQFSGAVASYLASLKTGSQVIPVERIGELLESLKKAHPEEFEIGAKLSAIMPNLEESMLRSTAFGRMMPGLRPGSPQPPSVLVVPAAPGEPKSSDQQKEEPPGPNPSNPGKKQPR